MLILPEQLCRHEVNAMLAQVALAFFDVISKLYSEYKVFNNGSHVNRKKQASALSNGVYQG